MTGEGANTGPDGEGATLDDVLRHATRRLALAGVDAPAREARLLVAHALGTTHAALWQMPRHQVVDAPGLAALLRRRADEREPLAFLLGSRGFWTLDLRVSPATLIPRADTETLVEAALHARPDRASVRRILDLGTGTGAILLALLGEYPAALGIGIDRSAAASRLARLNAADAGLARRALLACGDWMAAFDARFDLVVANPPYIASDDIAALMPEVAAHEPAAALDGGADGLDAYRAIFRGLPACLEPDGLAILEIGVGQFDAVRALGEASGLACAGVRADLGGTPRATLFARSDEPCPTKTVGSRGPNG